MEFVTAASIEAVPVQWLMHNRIPYGAISILEGEPGSSKSTLLAYLAARASTGQALPGGSAGNAATVLWLHGEDTKDQIQRRLRRAGADMDRVLILNTGNEGDDAAEHLPGLVPDLRRHVMETQARVVFIDPVTSFAGSLNSDAAVRRSLGSLNRLADETGIAVLLVRHLRKSNGGSVLHAGAGSIALTGIARSVLLMAVDPLNPQRRFLAHSKSNIARLTDTLVFELAGDSGSSALEHWGEAQLTASQVLQSSQLDDSAVMEAAIWLQEQLSPGPQFAQGMLTAARNALISERTLRRAKKFLGVESKRDGYGADGHYRWQLPRLSPIERADQYFDHLARPVRRVIIPRS